MRNFMLKIPEELHKELKIESAKTDVTMTKIILDALLKELKERKKK